MKKVNGKIIAVVLVIVAIIIGVILLLSGSKKDKSIDEKDLKTYEKYVTDYFANLTVGYNTAYKGIDILFANDEVKVEDLSEKQLISTAIYYMSMTGESTSVDYPTIQALYRERYPEVENSALYNAEDIRKAIKKLFGIEDFANPSTTSDFTYLVSYKYLAEEDIYIVVDGDSNQSLIDNNQFVEYEAIDTEVKDGKIVTTLAVAYGYVNGENATYASDRYGEKIVKENTTEFPKDKIDKLDKYEFTLTKSKDGKSYIFESVKKVK